MSLPIITLYVSSSVFGSQNVSKMDLSTSTPNRSTLAMLSPVAATPTPVYSLFTPMRPLRDRTNKVVSPVLPVPSQSVRQRGYDLPSQAGGFLPSEVPSQTGQQPDSAQTHDNPVMVSILKSLPSRPENIPLLEVAAPELLVSTNPDEVICIESCPDAPNVRVEPTATLCTKSCSTEGRANSPELFDSDDLSSQLPSTHCDVMTKIDSVLKEMAGDQRGNVEAAPGSAITVKMDHQNVKQQTRGGLLEQIVKSKTRNGSSGLDSEERCRQPVDMSLETTSDTMGGSVQCRKPLFRNARKSLPHIGADDPGNAVGERGPTMSRSDAVGRKDGKIQSNVRMTSKLNLRETGGDPVIEQSDQETQPCCNDLDHVTMEVKCEPSEGAAVPASDEPSLKRNVRNKRRRSFGAGCRKKGRGVEFIDSPTEGGAQV